jgi:hypothetical protein
MSNKRSVGKRMIIKGVVFVVSALFVPPAWSAVYYVAEVGRGAADGSSYSNRASAEFHNSGRGVFGQLAGDTVYLCGRIKTLLLSDGGRSGEEIEYRGDCSGDPGVIGNVSSKYGIYGEGKSFIKFANLTIENSREDGLRIDGGPAHITIEGVTVRNTGVRGIILTSTRRERYVEDCLVKDSVFQDIGRWRDTVSSSLMFAGFARRNTVENCDFRGDGVSRGVDGIVFN